MQLFDKKLLLLKTETVYGTDSVPTGAVNAILGFNFQFDPNPQSPIARRPNRPYLGNAKRPIAARHVGLNFDVEIAGSGALGTVPGYGPALRAGGMAETINVSTSVEYDPVSGSYESASLYFNMDGVEHRALGYRAGLAIVAEANSVPVYRFTGMGLHVDPAAVAFPTADFTGFREPLPVEEQTTPTFTLDGFAATMRSLNFDLAHRVIYRNHVNTESVEITGREPTGTVQIEAPPLATKNFFDIAKAETLVVMQLVHGTAAGDIVQIDAPAVQLMNPRYEDVDGLAYLTMDLNPTPTTSGDDELKVTVR